MVGIRRLPAKKLSFERRHTALTCLDKMHLEVIYKKVLVVSRYMGMLRRRGSPSKVASYYRRFLIMKYMRITNGDKMNIALTKLESKHRTIDSFSDEDLPGSFRFHTKDQLHALVTGFQIPEKMTSTEGCVFSGEECLLVFLYRLRRPTTTTDLAFKTIFGFRNTRVSICVRTFMNFMVDNWSYLLLDNLSFWKSYLLACATAIWNKLRLLGCDFPAPGTPGGFNVAAFIDNTMNGTCRPGGGPRRDGANAPRNDPMIQRAFYSGWKKMLGLKWQTVDLPNGMNAHVWGPCSLRHCDLWTLRESDINALFATLQEGDLYQFVMYGDSIYPFLSHLRSRHVGDNLSDRLTLENRMMSSCRETIEWDYGNVGYMWKLVDYKHALKIRQMPVGKLYFMAMLLRNAHVTMNGCQAASFFGLLPPTFTEWVSQGPRHMDIVVPMDVVDEE